MLRVDNLATFACWLCRNYRSLNFLNPWGPELACKGTALSGWVWCSRALNHTLSCMENCWFLTSWELMCRGIRCKASPLWYPNCVTFWIGRRFYNSRRQKYIYQVCKDRKLLADIECVCLIWHEWNCNYYSSLNYLWRSSVRVWTLIYERPFCLKKSKRIDTGCKTCMLLWSVPVVWNICWYSVCWT